MATQPDDCVSRVGETDALIGGGGPGAARAAVATAEAGAKTIVALKKTLGRSGATNYPRKGTYGSAWQAADGCGGPDDSPEVHYPVIMRAALGMADAVLAWSLAHESPERLDEIARRRFRLIPDPDGKRHHHTGYSCLVTLPRAHGMVTDEIGEHTGNMVAMLITHVQARGGEAPPETAVIDVLIRDGVCVGALAIGPSRNLGAVLDRRCRASDWWRVADGPIEQRSGRNHRRRLRHGLPRRRGARTYSTHGSCPSCLCAENGEPPSARRVDGPSRAHARGEPRHPFPGGRFGPG